MWQYVQLVLIPYQMNQSMQQSPRGNLSDLYPRWLGTRELLLHQRDPYGADVTRQIQIGYYGRPLDATRPHDPKDQQGFAYPIYVVLMLAPSIRLPFATVNVAFFWLFAVFTAATVPLWLGTLGWRCSKTAQLIWIVLALSCFPAIQALKLRQLMLLVAVLLAGSMAAVVRGRFVLGGILLALATIKPQLVFLLIVWLCMWVVGEWQQRQRLLWSFAITMAALVGAGEFLLPGWLNEFRLAMKDYYRYTGGATSLLDSLLSPVLGGTTAVVLVAILLVFAWKMRQVRQETLAFQWSLCFTIATTLLVIPRFGLYNQLLLLPGVMMALRARHALWAKCRFSRIFYLITAFSISWPFFAAAGLVIALAFLPGATVQKASDLPFYATFAIPITIYALLLVSRKVMTDPTRIGSA
jgi:hypothetical protein